jgi:hypothetical protein
LKERGSFACSLTTLWRTLGRFGLIFKEKTLHPSERGQPKVQAQRLQFLDETGVHTAMTRTGT